MVWGCAREVRQVCALQGEQRNTGCHWFIGLPAEVCVSEVLFGLQRPTLQAEALHV